MTGHYRDDSNADGPVWNEDGTRILYTSDRRGAYEVYERQVGNVSADRLILPSKNFAQPIAAATSGQMFYVTEPPREAELWFWPKGGTSPRTLSGARSGTADLSWDGKWLAQLGVHGDNARFNIYVRSLDEPPRTAQVTAEGGGQPTWRRDGRELYYVRLDGQVVAIDFNDGQLRAQTPLFQLDAESINYSNRDFVPNADGSRFVVLQRVAPKQEAAATVVMRH